MGRISSHKYESATLVVCVFTLSHYPNYLYMLGALFEFMRP